MPAQNRRTESDISDQLEALARERTQLKAAWSRGEIEHSDFARSMSKNTFLENQIREQSENTNTRSKARETDRDRGRERNNFGD